ncbi:MAG: hypothetical protein H7339_06770 [Arcicella sp.]|nr:hypothetical protein [Arcicella sp.]
MEMLFNELSTNPLSSDKYTANDKINLFAQTFGIAREKGFRNIRSHVSAHEIELSQGYSLFDWFNKNDVSRDYKDFLFGVIVQPYIKDEDEEIESKYIKADYHFEDLASGMNKTKCIGLAAAYLYDTLSISLSSSPVWDKILLPISISIEKDDETLAEYVFVEYVFNASKQSSFDTTHVANFVQKIGTVSLINTPIIPQNKKIHLAGDHHGKAELQELCNQLKNNPYVEEMRSTNFGGKNFIRKTYPDGVIEIVLVKTARQYALWVQTTGRNLRETNEIAEILKDKYC